MKKALSGPITILFIAIFFLYQTSNIQTLDVIDGPGADFYPGIILIFIIALSILSILITILKNKNIRTSNDDKDFFSWKVLLMFLSFTAYILVLDIIGFVVASTIFMMFVYLLLVDKKRGWKTNILVVISLFLSALTVSIIFENFLNVFLPKGLLF